MDIIKKSYNSQSFANVLSDISFKDSISIYITGKYGQPLYLQDCFGGNGYIQENKYENINELLNKVIDSENNFVSMSVKESNFNKKMLIYGTSLGSGTSKMYVFMETLMEPVDSTTMIVKKQLFIITIMVFSIAVLITVFISTKISKPIVSIINSAKQLAKGKYNTKFEGGEYLEAEELAEVLNYAGSEISKVDALRRELIANISHDIRTPLTIIKAYAEMVRDLSGDNPEKRNGHINVIIDESDRLSNLVSSLLELSKLESGNTSLELSQFSINDEFVEALNRYKIYEDRDGYSFEFNDIAKTNVIADVTKIQQVIYNLINNAVNYTGEDKKIVINLKDKGEFVRAEIIDSGKGISKEMLPLIFDRYYRDKKTEREVVGTGLGLSIVKEIMKLHGYPFGVNSVKGKGSTFWFEIKKA